MGRIKVNLIGGLVNGKQVSFFAPCSSDSTEGLVINDIDYDIVDSDGVSVCGLENVWNAGAIVSVILNIADQKAFIQNANTNPYIEEELQRKTQNLQIGDNVAMEDCIPYFSQSEDENKRASVATLKKVLGVQEALVSVTTCEGAEVVCTDGNVTLTGTGSTQFSLGFGVWTITSTLDGVSAVVTVDVSSVMKYEVDLMIVDSLEVRTLPTKTTYFLDEQIDTSGMEIIVTYMDGTTEDISDKCIITPDTARAKTSSVVVSHTRASRTVTAEIPITIRKLTGITVDSAPTKVAYKYGEMFNPEGMLVTASYDDGESRRVNEWEYSPSVALTLEDTEVTITYTEDDITMTQTQEISVSNALVSIDVTTPPSRTTYYEQMSIETEGMVITATMLDGSTKVVSSYNYIPLIVTTNTSSLTIFYEEDGVSASCSQEITVVPISPVLNENSWEAIRAISDMGLASNYWNIGDTKTITISGTVQNKALDLSIDVFIIGFDHNSAREGTNRIHFQIGKINGKSVALCDDLYNTESDTIGFYANSGKSSWRGWKNSYMSLTLLGNSGTPASPTSGSLMAALPADLRAVIKPVTKYSVNEQAIVYVGTATDQYYDYPPSYVTASTNYLFMLAVPEVIIDHDAGYRHECVFQTMYDYYKAGNSLVSYNQGLSILVNQMSRSPSSTSTDGGKVTYNRITSFHVSSSSSLMTTSTSTNWHLAMSPCFCV